MTDFHPDDPTVWVWKKLLRKNPVSINRKPMNRIQKNRISKKLRNYWLEHEHPRTGKQFGK